MDNERGRELAAMLIDAGARGRHLAEARGNPKGYENDRLLWLTSRFAVKAAEFNPLMFSEQRWLEAVAVGKTMTNAALAGRSAARVHGMWIITKGEEKVELVSRTGRSPSKSQWPKNCVYLPQRVRKGEIQKWATLRATDPVTAACEIALRHGFREGLVAMDWILKHHTTREAVEAEVAKFGPVKNLPVLRKVLRYAVANSRSPFESYARAILIEKVCADWIVNQVFLGVEVDLRRGLFINEIDGGFKYDGVTFKPTDQALREERTKEKELLKGNCVLLRTPPTELLFHEDRYVADVIRLVEVAEQLERSLEQQPREKKAG